MEILKLRASCMDYLWGGQRLKNEFGKVTDLEKVAESWELSVRDEAPSYIENGEYAGRTLKEYINENPESAGEYSKNFDFFPLLIKLIDAKENLSVQVHPSQNYAKIHEHSLGKTEMWYIIDAEPEAELIYGFKENITKAEFEDRIKNNTLLDAVNRVKVKKGDVYFIPSGTLHAIGKGILIAEIQENSNITYRVYDYNRKDKNGKTRPLHIKQALDVTKLCPCKNSPKFKPFKDKNFTKTLLEDCKYFRVWHIENKGTSQNFSDEKSFSHILVTGGRGRLNGKRESFEIAPGCSFFVPAGYGKYEISGNAEYILSQIGKN